MLTILRDYLEENNRKVYIVEIGAGCPVAQGLYDCPGASKVVYHSESPYGSANDLYGSAIGSHRMVSKETVECIIGSIKDHMIKKFNMIIVTSFQIKSGEDDIRIPHGWVGISRLIDGQWIDEYYHLTLAYIDGKMADRIESIHSIGGEIERIIVGYATPWYVDVAESPTIFETKCPVFFKNNEPFRLEEVSRKYKRIALYKGSFNPLHYGHVEIANRVSDEDTLVIFAISKNTYEKGLVNIDSFIDRLSAINNKGFIVAFFEEGYFYDNTQYLKNRTGLPVDLVMGVDTFNRLIKCYDNCDFSSNEEYSISKFMKLHNLEIFGESYSETVNRNKSLLFNLNFWNTSFIVFGRNQELYKSDIDVSVMFHREFDCPISSSEIRQLEESGYSENANQLKQGKD